MASHSITELSPLSTEFINLADVRLGARVLSASDEFFAEKENLLVHTTPIFIDDKFTHLGKWMDGWESRRRRDDGHDWCIIKLAMNGTLKGADVDTTHFRGNAPQSISIDAAPACDGIPPEDSWKEILPCSSVEANSHNFFNFKSDMEWRFLRLHIYPDGGVARFKAYGDGRPDWEQFVAGELVDMAAAENGGCSVGCSDMFFSPKDNLIMPGRGINMGDGWETKRSRRKGSDWNVIKLASASSIKKVIIDTAHFKGNYPDSFSLEACLDTSNRVPSKDTQWEEVIAQRPLNADIRHIFIKEILNTESNFSHVRLNIYPDGGVSRMSIYGPTP